MLEITAKLVKGSVYLPGEKIVCCVTFSNKREGCDGSEALAWASAQIHCLCSTNSKLTFIRDETAQPRPGLSSPSASDTSFVPYKSDGPGQVVYSSTAKILFCDLRLEPQKQKTFFYTEVLPNDAPSSFKGQLVKYSYKITIGTQRLNCPAKLLRVPLRVLGITGLPDYNVADDSEDLAPSNPFLETHDNEHEVGPALQLVQNITARRNPNFYNVTNSRGKVGRFCLFKQAYKLGEDIVGTFDFTQSTIPCVQLTVTLQCQEEINEKYKPVCKQDVATASFSKHHEVCLYLTHCLLNLPIPFYVTPGFNSELMSLTWRLHFEFVTSLPGSTEVTLQNGSWEAPSCLNIETMIWDLPIQIYPTIIRPEPCTDSSYKLNL